MAEQMVRVDRFKRYDTTIPDGTTVEVLLPHDGANRTMFVTAGGTALVELTVSTEADVEAGSAVWAEVAGSPFVGGGVGIVERNPIALRFTASSGAVTLQMIA